MTNHNLLKEKIKQNEGYRNVAYLDGLGFLTIGYGHLIKNDEKHLMSKKLKKKDLINIFNFDFNKALKQYDKHYGKYKFPKVIKECIIEMIFQLGIRRQKKFKKMNNYLKNNQIFMACLEMKSSLWYIQTPKRVDGMIEVLIKYNYEKKN